MKRRRRVLGIIAMAVICCGVRESFGQVDPFWMRSWTEAQRTRPSTMTSTGRIAPADEPGTPLTIHGRVFEPDGRTPAAGVIVHAYHRDREGFDFGPNDSVLTTWRLQGWVKTDADGRFELRTIRPAPDHMGREGAHVHFTLETQKFGRQWPHAIFFSDDARVTGGQREQSAQAGEFGWVREVTTQSGAQHVTIQMRLKPKGDF